MSSSAKSLSTPVLDDKIEIDPSRSWLRISFESKESPSEFFPLNFPKMKWLQDNGAFTAKSNLCLIPSPMISINVCLEIKPEVSNLSITNPALY